MSNAASWSIRTVTPAGQVLEESTLLAGSTGNLTLNRSFDPFGRVQGLSLTGADLTVSRGFAYGPGVRP